MRLALILALLSALPACGAPEPFEAMVYFTVTTPDGHLTKQAATWLVVSKPDGTRLIDGWPEDAGEGERTGRHNFPPNSTGPGIVAYYWGVLNNAGWKDGVDFVADPAESRIAFAAVTAIDVGDDSDEILSVVKRTGE